MEEGLHTRMKTRREFQMGIDSIRITGPFDTLSEHVLDFAKSIVEEGKKVLIVDLSEATYMTSQGIACIIKMMKLTKPAGCEIHIFGANSDMEDLLRLARIDNYVKIT